MKATIKSIAEIAGVSRGTVDRVIHGRDGVSEETKKKILEIVAKEGLKVNKSGNVFEKSPKGEKIVAVFPRWGGYADVLIDEGINMARNKLSETGIEIIVQTFDFRRQNDAVDILTELLKRKISGLAVFVSDTMANRKLVNEFTKKNVPVTTFNSDVDAQRVCFVGDDAKKSGRVAAEILSKFLAEEDEFMIVAGRYNFSGHRNRVEGFLEVMQEKGFDIDNNCHIVYTQLDRESTYRKVYDEMKENNKIKGIYMSNRNVHACCEALNTLGVSKRVRIVCHDISKNRKELLKKGDIDFALDNKFHTQIYKALCVLENIIAYGEYPCEDQIVTRSSIVNAENIDDYLVTGKPV